MKVLRKYGKVQSSQQPLLVYLARWLGPSAAYPLWVVTQTSTQSRQSYTAHYCGEPVAHWHWLVRPTGWPHWTAAWAAASSSCPWWGWWPSTTSRCQHQIGWVIRHPLVRWQWGHPPGYAAIKTAWLLRTDPHENPIWNQDVAGASKGDANIPWFWPDGRTRLQLMCCTCR